MTEHTLTTKPIGEAEQLGLAGAESTLRWRVCTILAAALILIYSLLLARMVVPAYWGVDEHGYLMEAKLIASSGHAFWTPRDPVSGEVDRYQFVGRQFVGQDMGTALERYIVKYPLGLPLVMVAAMKLGGPHAAFWVSPVATVVGLIAVFLAAQMLLGSIGGVLSLLLAMASPILFAAARIPQSQALSFGVATLAAAVMVAWWRKPSLRWAVLAGLLAGLSVWIRYTDGLLLLPIAFCAVNRLARCYGPERKKAAVQTVAMLFCWLAPVLALLAWNLLAMGMWSGYGARGDSSNFSLVYLQKYWSVRLNHCQQVGLPLLAIMVPVALLACCLWRRSVGLVLCLWSIPTLVVYLCYFFTAPRFFIPVLAPGVIACAALLVDGSQKAVVLAERVRLQQCARPICVVIVLALVGASLQSGVRRASTTAKALVPQQKDLIDLTEKLHPSTRTAVFAGDMALANHVQYATDCLVYDDILMQYACGLRTDLEKPLQCSDPLRGQHIQGLVSQLSQRGALLERSKLMRRLLENGFRVVVLQSPSAATLPLGEGMDVGAFTPIASSSAAPDASGRGLQEIRIREGTQR